MSYTAPVKEMMFVMNSLANLQGVSELPGFEDAGPETASAVLEECAKFNESVVAPLNWTGDLAPSTLKDGVVTTTKGFAEAFKQYAEAGWQGVQHPTEFGGQGLPKTIGAACIEMLNAANMSFALCPLLSDGAIEALLTAGSPEQQALYLPKLISGQWTGTMNLTEPQAGSDLALVRSKAVKQPDGTYRVTGQKIYITYGEHDMAENIVHLVLARTPEAPEGIKGISLFIVPKFLINADGTLGQRNDVWCQSIEHKLGIKASPTAVLLYGDGKGDVGRGENGVPGAIGYLIGEENRGLEYMFVMMNSARYSVGMQGIAVAERAYQKAVGYARDRLQSRDVGGSSGAVAIIHHPDVRRMLMTMRATIEGARALAYVAAAASDAGHYHTDPVVRKTNMSVYEYLVPIVKGWSTEMSIDVTSLGVQVHGGMGFIEETGAAQFYRDARILPIYEGTTAIQANDLVGRKTVRDQGATAKGLLSQMQTTIDQLKATNDPQLLRMAEQLVVGQRAYLEVVDFIASQAKTQVHAVFAGSVPYLKMAGIVLSAWQMGRAALAVRDSESVADPEFAKAKLATARFYCDHLLPQGVAMAQAICEGGDSVMAMPVELY